ncbi:MAG: glycosyltransferase [Bacteroidales bacterium]|nr:glycosyltransferase [Bacteroidales bacterium]
MKLSVVIVNYNVKHFLEQCLNSVAAAAEHCETEVFVVDNNSVDGSCNMLREKFPWVKLIENKKNYGFSYANNQAIKQSTGEYVLLLNPDTVIEEDTLKSVCYFMDAHPDAGGLGVKMIDGKGRFLPESKRGLPTPQVAFYKIFGLSKLFPRSKKFGKYHLTYLDKDQIHKVDVLSGAFMLLRAETLNKIGLLDETFFMYGEDIDLSYRITLGGYNNYYYPETTIIHYKGESTKKGSVNYVLVFYNAMKIFARKHFSKGKGAGTMIFFINLAIYLRAAMAIAGRFITNAITPVIDALLILAGFLIITPLWETHLFGEGSAYPHDVFVGAMIMYISVWLLSLLLSGGYDKPVKMKNIYKGIFIGAVVILAVYALLPTYLRFSRALILLGTAWTLIVIPLVRLLLNYSKLTVFKVNLPKRKKVAVVGSKEECRSLVGQLMSSRTKVSIVAYVSPDSEEDKFFAGDVSQLDEIVTINKIDELIFCAKDIQAQQIIKTMLNLSSLKLDYKIASPDGFSVIGSNSINTTGELYNIDINAIDKPENRRSKRMFDFVVSLLMILLSPILIWFIKGKLKAYANLFAVLFGSKTFVSYCTAENDITLLPKIKKGVFSVGMVYGREVKKDVADRLNIMYAKDYHVSHDVTMLFKLWRKLGCN